MALTVATGWATPAFAQQPSLPRPVSAPLSPVSDVILVYGDRLVGDPGSYSVIGTEDIAAVYANHPAEVLNMVPGVNVQMNSGQELLIAIRSPVLPAGAGQGSFLILENGVPIRAPAFGNVNALFELHHETAEAIEIVRGPASVRYGTNAVHGLLNVIAPEPDARAASTFTVSANTLQRYRADSTANFSVGGVDHFAALSVMDDGGWRDASGVDQQKLTIRSMFRGDDWKAVASLTAINLNQETAGFLQGRDAYEDEDFAKTNANPEAYRDAWAARANLRFEQSINDTDRLTITPFAITQRMIFIQHFLPDQSTEKNGHDSLGVMARYSFGPEAVRWSIGADIQYADGYLKEIQSRATFGPFPKGIHYDYDVETWMIGLYGELDWDFATDWSLLAGVRAENNAYDYVTNKAPGTTGRFRVAPSRTDEFNLFTPKVGILYSGLGWGSLYANYARGERAPQASDQYRLQNLQIIEQLDVETLDSFEVGARGEIGPAHFDVAAYAMKKDNFFFRDSDGLNVPNGKTDHVGVEVALDGELGPALGGRVVWNVNVAWSDQTYAFNRNVVANAEDIVDGARIDTAPEWLADFGLGWENERVSLSASAEYVGEYFTNAANTARYDGHIVAHLRGAWRFSEGMEAFLVVRNLADERYADRADFAQSADRYFPGEPLNATLGVRLRR
ncbi:MAG: TonB-dependent receptor [Alphaproteobacteria bacterium]|nr:TonB-dependent receptor [Alphaproteobacteria bacterium]